MSAEAPKEAAATNIDEVAEMLRVEVSEVRFLESLGAAEIALVQEGLKAAVANQREQINQAIEESLSHVPRVLHRPIRRILFPGK